MNAKGFHGSLAEDPRLEKQLFNTAEHASQGINFDRVRFRVFGATFFLVF